MYWDGVKALETKETLLNAICSRSGGVDIYEAMERTGMSYKQIEREIHQLMGKGYQLTALPFGCYNPGSRFSGWIKRIYLSPYDPKHKDLIKNNGSVGE